MAKSKLAVGLDIGSSGAKLVQLKERKGGFALHHSAGENGHHLIVLPGSGHGELAGITGTAEIVQDDEGNHTFTLTYEL